MNNVILLFVSIGIVLGSLPSASMSSVDDDVQWQAASIKAIKKRYPIIEHDIHIFSEEQRSTIRNLGIAPLIQHLVLHKMIRFEELEDVVDFAVQAHESGIDFSQLEPRIIKYLTNGELVFTALTKAIDRQQFHNWREAMVERVSADENKFAQQIGMLNLAEHDQTRVLRVYATCIASFEQEADRVMMTPKICDAIDDYQNPRHQKHPVSLCTDHDTTPSIRGMAYSLLMKEAQRVANKHELTTFERVIMSKCIAEQSLRFFQPSRHPLKALHKNRMLTAKSPEQAFFMRTGVCSNFSGITKNVADDLGLDGTIHLAKKGVHVYLEFEENGEWFHVHPFDSKSKCSITRFSSH